MQYRVRYDSPFRTFRLLPTDYYLLNSDCLVGAALSLTTLPIFRTMKNMKRMKGQRTKRFTTCVSRHTLSRTESPLNSILHALHVLHGAINKTPRPERDAFPPFPRPPAPFFSSKVCLSPRRPVKLPPNETGTVDKSPDTAHLPRRACSTRIMRWQYSA